MRPRDAERLREWRNAQLDVLRQQHPLTSEQQRCWYDEVLLSAHAAPDPPMLLVSVLRDGGFVAYGGLTNIDWPSRRAEVSFLADPARAADPTLYREDFTAFLDWLKGLAFDELSLVRLFTETYAFREGHIRLLEAAGFDREGVRRGHVVTGGRRVDSVLHGLLSDHPGGRRDG